MTHGGIAGWKKKEGEFVATGDIIAEIQTDKATMEMESMEEGWMAKIIVPEGTEDIPVGKPVAVLCEEQADIAAFKDYVPEASADAPPARRRRRRRGARQSRARATRLPTHRRTKRAAHHGAGEQAPRGRCRGVGARWTPTRPS